MNGPIAIQATLGGSAAIAVPKSATVYTDAINIAGLDTFALTYVAACTGTPDLKIEIEQGIVPPAAGNAADANFTAPVGLSAVEANLIAKTVSHKAISPVAVQFIRFKITEQTGTVTDTVVTMHLSALNRFPTG